MKPQKPVEKKKLKKEKEKTKVVKEQPKKVIVIEEPKKDDEKVKKDAVKMEEIKLRVRRQKSIDKPPRPVQDNTTMS